MNKERRKRIKVVIESLAELEEELEAIKAEEERYMENIPENLAGTQRYEDAEEAVDNLGEAIGSIDSVVSNLKAVTGEEE